MRRNEEHSGKVLLGVALRQHNLPSRVFMLLKSILVMDSVLMSPARTNLPQSFKFFFSILESHSTIEGVTSPSEKICVLVGKCDSNCCLGATHEI